MLVLALIPGCNFAFSDCGGGGGGGGGVVVGIIFVVVLSALFFCVDENVSLCHLISRISKAKLSTSV